MGPGETHVHENIVQRIHTAGDDHVTVMGGQFHHGQMNGAQRTGTCGIHHAIGATQVQAVADAPGDHVSQ